MRKLLLTLLVCFLFNGIVAAQKMMHGFGITTSSVFGRIYTSGGGYYSFSLGQASFSYFPRYNLTENDNSSFSVGAPIGLGLGLVSGTYGDVGTYFAYELPVVLDYNIGLRSTHENDNGFGGYIGAGFSYYHVSVGNSTYNNFSGNTYGPLVRAGVRFHVPTRNGDPKVFTFGIFYKKGIEDTKLTTIGFNFIYEL